MGGADEEYLEKKIMPLTEKEKIVCGGEKGIVYCTARNNNPKSFSDKFKQF